MVAFVLEVTVLFPSWVILNCSMVLVGLFVLGRYRDRSRRATGIGIVALCGLGFFGLMPLMQHAIVKELFGPDLATGWAFPVAQMLGWTLCTLLMVVAIVIDRR